MKVSADTFSKLNCYSQLLPENIAENNANCYIASVNTKRDWLICSHVALDKCNVSRPGNK